MTIAVESSHIATIADTQELPTGKVLGQGDGVDGRLAEVLVGGLFGDFVHAHRDGAGSTGLAEFREVGSQVERGHGGRHLLIEEQVFGLVLREQIDVLADRFLGATRLHVVQRLAVLKGNRGGDALDLLHIDYAIAPRHELCRGIANAVDVDRKYTHGTGRNGQLWQLNTACLQLHIALCGEVL